MKIIAMIIAYGIPLYMLGSFFRSWHEKTELLRLLRQKNQQAYYSWCNFLYFVNNRTTKEGFVAKKMLRQYKKHQREAEDFLKYRVDA